jgi:hypothetical protein
MDFERIPRLEYELPQQRQCRLCRSSFRSEHAKHALCETCRVVIGTYENAVTKELELANWAAACYREPLVQNAREDLTCPDCDWFGNQSGIADSSWESRHGRKRRRRYKGKGGRKEPRTILKFLLTAPDYAERLLRHQRQRHWKMKPVQRANFLNDIVAASICPRCNQKIGTQGSFAACEGSFFHLKCLPKEVHELLPNKHGLLG